MFSVATMFIIKPMYLLSIDAKLTNVKHKYLFSKIYVSCEISSSGHVRRTL